MPPSFGVVLPADADTIVALHWANERKLVSAGWDGHVRFHDVNLLNYTSNLVVEAPFGAPVLACTPGWENNRAFVAGANGVLAELDADKSVFTEIGKHDKGIRCCEVCPTQGCVLTGSWDGTIKGWDTRARKAQFEVNLNSAFYSHKVYAMALHGFNAVVGYSGTFLAYLDLRNTRRLLPQTTRSTLAHQTRCIATARDGAYVVASIEGRCAVRYFDDSQDGRNRFAFKCHRDGRGDAAKVYPVHAVHFHPSRQHVFATVGGDGKFCVWDKDQKQRLSTQVIGSPGKAACTAVSLTNKWAAIATGYDWSNGADEASNAPAPRLRIVQLSSRIDSAK